MKRLGLAALGLVAALSGCAHKIDEVDVPGDGDASKPGGGNADGRTKDSGPFSNPGQLRDATTTPTLDAFFINDPAPPMCGEDGTMHDPPAFGGTTTCPEDKNREGCSCPKEGMQAACWPGRRLNRNHGICKDGVTTCNDSTEFGLLWGPCEGYVLPEKDAVEGAAACRCFSDGIWELSNRGPCIFGREPGDDRPKYLYSSSGVNGDGTLNCAGGVTDPPAPTGSWSTTELTVDCAGQYRLCFTIKAGDIAHVKPDDCTIMESCVDAWYPKAGEKLRLDDLPAWTSDEKASACVTKFIATGGYGEMSVVGKSVECDAIDDGTGKPFVFARTDYCPPSCQQTPDTPECKPCTVGGSGMFGN